MLNLCVIGAGEHSRRFHLPALAAIVQRHKNHVALCAICDLNPDRASETARIFGFARNFADPALMLTSCPPDACLVIAPLATTANLTLQLLRAGCPVLVEKPLGSSIEAARAFVSAAAEFPTPVMVSMNRRFDPMTQAALKWIGERRVTSIKAVMRRQHRNEPDFLTSTGIHIVDLVRSIGGEVAGCESNAQWVNEAWWWTMRMRFANDVEAIVEIQPTHDRDEEYLQFSGRDFWAESRSAEFDLGRWQGCVEGKLVQSGDTAGLTPFEANGTYAETMAFIDSIHGSLPLHPTPATVLPSMELCYAAAQQVKSGVFSKR